MRYRVLAFDYDGTLAKHGVVADSTVATREPSDKTVLDASGRASVGDQQVDEQLGLGRLGDVVGCRA